jgi:uncharacterized membrane protein YbhN (UPF0104 family)
MSTVIKFAVILLNLIIFGTFAIWLRDNVSFSQVLTYLVGAPAEVFLAALLLNLFVFVAYGFRLASIIEQRFLPSLGTALLGFGLQGILPFRLGDLLKIAYARRMFRVPSASLAAGTVMEKILDLGALVLIGLSASQTGRLPAIDAVMGVAIGILVLAVVVFAIGVWAVHRWHRLAGARAAALLAAANMTLRKTKPRTLIVIVCWTGVIWLLTVLMIYVIFSGLFTGFGLRDAAMLALIVSLAIALPSAPAGLGIVEAGIVGYLHQVLNVDPNQALAAALAFHFVTSVPQILAALSIIGWNWKLVVGTRPPQV